MAAEFSKNLKSADTSLSRIQALFLDAVRPLSDLLDKVNNNTELSVEDMEGAVKASLTFIGNASSQYTALLRTGILEEYNKDLVSFSQESGELFAFATNTLFGPSFPENAASTSSSSKLCDELVAVAAQVDPTRFSQRYPHVTHSGGQILHPSEKRPYYRGGARGRGAPVNQWIKSRTSYTQIFNNKRICKPYNCLPFTAGLHEATDSTAVTSSSWEVESLIREVLTTDKWVIETVKGFQIPFVGHPVQACRPNAPIYYIP